MRWFLHYAAPSGRLLDRLDCDTDLEKKDAIPVAEPGLTPVILVVEDEHLVRLDIVGVLNAAGFATIDFSSGEEAISLLANGDRIDAVFTDIQLAGPVTGWHVAEAFRATRPATQVIYASGNASDRSRQVAGSHFFNKPYQPNDVIKAIKSLLDDDGSADGQWTRD